MDALRIKVHHLGGRSEELVIETETIRIGSGAHCEVRLPIDQARFEHVVARATASGVVVSARAFDPPPTLDGVDFTEALLPPGAVLRIHQSSIEISSVARIPDVLATDQGKRATNRRPAVILVLGLAAAGLMIAAKPRAKDTADDAPLAPQLFAAERPVCPRTSAEAAEAIALAKLDLATIKRERSPFHPEDGVLGVPLYELAAACFRVAGKQEEEEEASAAATQLKARVSDEFRMHQVRLQYALKVKDWKMAQDEVRTLRDYALTAEGPDGSSQRGARASYAVWLSNLDRKIELTHGGKKK
ncbi:MAG TPA: hypothetical protein VK540_10750 [Polyangiaceae bacterium]|nr:hypothetical protein [Polyangiaceae bacterium]